MAMCGKITLSAAVFFFLLGMIFTIVGYVVDWLVPRLEYSSSILGIGLRVACFDNFRFKEYIDRERQIIDGCQDVSKNSAKFAYLEDYVSPLWFQQIQDMHLASLLLCVFTFLFILGFLTVYFFIKYQLRRRKRPSSAMLITKAGLALWFLLTLIISLLQITEPAMFYHNYEQSRNIFWYSDSLMDYGPGFGVTIASGLCLLASSGLGLAFFCGILKKMLELARNPGDGKEVYTDDFDSVEARSTAEMERLSNDDRSEGDHSQPSSRKEPDGDDTLENFQKEPSRRSLHSEKIEEPTTEEPSAYANIPVRKTADGRPVPAPRMSRESSREPSREPSIDRSMDYGPPRDIRYSAPSSARPVSYNSNPTNNFLAPRSARPSSETASQHSYASQPHSHYTGASGYSPYNQPTQRYYPSPGSVSDTESQRGERNRSVSRSSRGADIYSKPAQEPPKQKVVKPKTPTDVKHSRYAAF